MSYRGTRARYSAIAIAIFTAATLLVRVVLASEEHGSVVSGVLFLSQFFTILTNFFVLIAMLTIALGYTLSKGILEALVVAIVCVGVIYHALLADLWSPQGLAMLADQGVHTVVPVLTFVWWLMFSEIGVMSWKDVFKATVWPLVYVCYALLRGQWSSFYPYPFLNLTELATVSLIYNIVGLSFVFFMLGLGLLVIDRCRSHLN